MIIRKPFFILLLSFCCYNAHSQFKVTFRLKSLPSYTAAGSKLFIAGNFNTWKPDANAFATGNSTLVMDLPKGSYEYKITRGSWQTVEAGTGGMATENRMLVLTGDTIINIEIAHWADHFKQNGKKHTAGKNVHVIDTAFQMPQLGRYRRIWVYLPESYASSRKKYPVLYMHDGQNVFDEFTANSGEWGVDEALDTLGTQTKECIVVAIDHGENKRMNEYAPYDFISSGTYALKDVKGEGDQYVDFLVKTLKPFIKKRYRVKSCRRHQSIAGSSMGGLISFYAMLKYPKAFGSAGVFSPAFWMAPQLKNDIATKGKRVKGKIYFYAGKEESESMVPDMLAVFNQMGRVSKAKLTTVIRTGGKHNEAQWRQEFPLFYTWLMIRPARR